MLRRGVGIRPHPPKGVKHLTLGWRKVPVYTQNSQLGTDPLLKKTKQEEKAEW